MLSFSVMYKDFIRSACLAQMDAWYDGKTAKMDSRHHFPGDERVGLRRGFAASSPAHRQTVCVCKRQKRGLFDNVCFEQRLYGALGFVYRLNWAGSVRHCLRQRTSYDGGSVKPTATEELNSSC